MAISIPILSEFDGTGLEKAIKGFQDLETNGQKAQYAIKKAAVPAAAAMAGLAAAIGVSVDAAIEDAASQARLARQIENSTGANAKQIKSVEDLISKMSIQAAVADDELRPAYANLIRNTRDLDRANYLLGVAMDVSAATGKDLESVTIALGKAENGQYTALKKLGIPMGDITLQLADLAKEEKKLAKLSLDLDNANAIVAEGLLPAAEGAKKLTKAQEAYAKQQVIVNQLQASAGDYATDLEEQFAGMAETAANTAEGGMKRLRISLNEATESLGAAFLPLVEKVTPVLQKFADWAMNNSQTFLVVAGVIGTIATAILAANVALKAWNIVTGLTSALNTALAASFTAIQVASGLIVFTAIIAGLVVAYNKFEWFRDGVKTVFNAIQTAIGFSLDVIKGYFSTVLSFYKTVFNGIAALWNNSIGKIKFEVPSWVPVIGGKGFAVPKIPELAEGGIVTGPTVALIGEAGAEAVVPLDRMGGMGSVTINVNGGDPRAVVDALRTYMSRYGSIPIRTVAP